MCSQQQNEWAVQPIRAHIASSDSLPGKIVWKYFLLSSLVQIYQSDMIFFPIAVGFWDSQLIKLEEPEKGMVPEFILQAANRDKKS